MLHAWLGAVAMKRSSRCRTAFLLRCGRFFKALFLIQPIHQMLPNIPALVVQQNADLAVPVTHSALCDLAYSYPQLRPWFLMTLIAIRASYHQKNPAGMPLARPPDTGRVNDRPSDGAPKASELFSEHILQHRLVQAQICNQLFQPAVLFLELFHLPSLIGLHANVLLLPGTPNSACRMLRTRWCRRCWHTKRAAMTKRGRMAGHSPTY